MPPRLRKRPAAKNAASAVKEENGVTDEDHRGATMSEQAEAEGDDHAKISAEGDPSGDVKAEGVDAEGQQQPRAKRAKRAAKKKAAKAKAEPRPEPNPFEMEPDADQRTVNEMFGWPAPEVKPKPEPSGSSSSSSSSSSTCPSFQQALGDLTQEDEDIPDAGCIVQADVTRDRKTMFSFPQRHISRLHKHYGENAVDTLKRNLACCSVVSLYSGLGGAEIAFQLTATALGKQLGMEPPVPEFLLACDNNADCQKILHSHRDTCSLYSKGFGVDFGVDFLF